MSTTDKNFDELMKERLENRVAREFLLSYNHAAHTRFIIVPKGKLPEPDVICEDASGHARVGIEVAVAYYDYGGTHAKSVWQLARKKKGDQYLIGRLDFEANVSVLA